MPTTNRVERRALISELCYNVAMKCNCWACEERRPNPYRTNVSSNPDLEEFIYRVQEDFLINQNSYLAVVQGYLPYVEILGIELTGSYSPGSSRQPTEDSDIDLRVLYRGSQGEQEVAEQLYGRISGYGGIFDIIPERVN